MSGKLNNPVISCDSDAKHHRAYKTIKSLDLHMMTVLALYRPSSWFRFTEAMTSFGLV